MTYDWPTDVIESWDQYVRVASALVKETFPTSYMFRGQSRRQWRLNPSLGRLLPNGIAPAKALDVERRLLEDFRSQAHLHVPAGLLPRSFPPVSPTEWWALMQHYGAPTRLLDWTQSPYVAAYFAVETDWEIDGSIFMVHVHTAQQSYKTHFGVDGKVQTEVFADPNAPQALLFWYPDRKSSRFVAQQSFAAIGTNLLCTHDELLVPPCAAATEANSSKLFYKRWIVPGALKPVFLRNLRAMNIAAHSLFPGLDGVCRSAAEDARLAFTGGQPNKALHPSAVKAE